MLTITQYNLKIAKQTIFIFQFLQKHFKQIIHINKFKNTTTFRNVTYTTVKKTLTIRDM